MYSPWPTSSMRPTSSVLPGLRICRFLCSVGDGFRSPSLTEGPTRCGRDLRAGLDPAAGELELGVSLSVPDLRLLSLAALDAISVRAQPAHSASRLHG